MRVWIDADACPRAAKDQVVKFALKRQFEVVLVAGQSQIKPSFACVKLIVVPSGPDAADDYLVEHAVPGELVICSDVPLADRLVKKGVTALDPRGKEFSPQNMSERLAVRNLFTDLRDVEKAAATLNDQFARYVNQGLDRPQVYDRMQTVMDNLARFGARDTEPRTMLRDQLDQVFGKRSR